MDQKLEVITHNKYLKDSMFRDEAYLWHRDEIWRWCKQEECLNACFAIAQEMSDRAASSSGLCTFMHCINVHKIYQMGHDPTDKFYNFMHVYACIKFIRVGPAVYA